MRRGFLYLIAVMDWASRKVLAWKLSNSMDADFCIQALEEALARHGAPEIFNTDSQCIEVSYRIGLTPTAIGPILADTARHLDAA